MPSPERHMSDRELAPFVAVLANRFVQRTDLYAKQLPDGSYHSIPERISAKHLIAHLRGEITLGTYLLNQYDQARFMVIDADDERGFQKLTQATIRLAEKGIPGYLETSRRGGHLWLFFDEAVDGQAVRQFGLGVMSVYDLLGMELYPRQARLQTGPGSLIRMPFGVHQLTKRRHSFITPEGDPLAPTLREQLLELSKPQTVSTGSREQFRGIAHKLPQIPNFELPETATDHISGQLKAAISVPAFVGRFVPLTPIGSGYIGRCPFHEDNHPSFGVNLEGNFWHCFAGCGGGSIIDFWMKWRECDFKTALSELSQMLL